MLDTPRILRPLPALVLLVTCLAVPPLSEAAKNRPEKAAPTTEAEPQGMGTYRSKHGYRLELEGTEWQHWDDVDEHVSHADVGAERRQGAFVTVNACFAQWQPGPEAVNFALLRSMGHQYPTPGTRAEGKLTIEGETARVWEFLRPREDQPPFRFRYHVIERGSCALLLTVWTTLDDDALDTMSTELVERLHFEPLKDTASNGAAEAAQAWFYNAAGLYFHSAENYLSAAEGFRLAATLDPGDTAYINNAASTYNRLNQYGAGLQLLKRPAIAEQEDSVVKGWLGWFEYHLGNYGEAAEHYRQGFELGELSEDDLYAYTQSLIQQGRLDRATTVVRRYAPKEPGVTAVQALTELAVAREAYEEALEILDKADARGVRSTALDTTRMDVLGAMREYERVVAYSDELIAQGRGSALVYNYRGDAQYQLERYNEAKASFEQALVLQPGDTNTAEYLRYTNAQLGKGDSASINRPIKPVAWPELKAPINVAGIEKYDSHYPLTVTAYRYDPDKPLKTTHVRHIAVHDQAGVQRHSTLYARFNPLSEKLYINRLDVFDTEDRKVSELDRSSLYIGDASDYDQATFGKVVRAPVAGLAPNYRIEFVYTLEERSVAEEFPFERLYLSGERPIGLAALYIEGDLKDLLYNQTNAPKPQKRNNSLLWAVENPTPSLWEPMQVDDEEYMASVVLVSENQWRSAGEDYRQRVDDLILAESPELAPLVEQLTGDLNPKDSRARIAALARYVQETLTYKALEFGVRGYTPNPPTKILQDRFGDCKDHSVLLWRLLREAGIPAELALANLSGPVDPDMPSIDQFDHMVVYLPEWRGGSFIDATNKDIDLLAVSPDGLGGSWTLTLGKKPDLVAVPALNRSQVRIQRDLEVQPNGDLDVTERVHMGAYFASTLRSHLKNIEPRERLNWVQRFLGDGGEPVAVESLSVDHLFATDKDLVLNLRYRVSPMGFWNEQNLVLDPAYWEHYYLSNHWVHNRQTDFEVSYPLVFETEVSYRAPHQEAIRLHKQDRRERRSEFGRFESHWDADEQRATRQFRFEVGAGRFEAAQYADYQRFTAQALDALRHPVNLKGQQP
ncbi:tetratricopeptide repeat protein [Marinimicrobium locisalis]|uniref:tetratricopeptide repeat protein n=1 Tax=Marinimicrobium locisalis TaxID=546022 RepID=UPI0032219641